MQRKQCKVWENLLSCDAAHARKHTKWKQDKIAAKSKEKAAEECLGMAMWGKLYKKFLELHIQRFKFYSYIYLHKLYLLIARD